MRQGPATWKGSEGVFPSTKHPKFYLPGRGRAPGHRPCGDTVSAQNHKRRQSGTEVPTRGSGRDRLPSPTLPWSSQGQGGAAPSPTTRGPVTNSPSASWSLSPPALGSPSEGLAPARLTCLASEPGAPCSDSGSSFNSSPHPNPLGKGSALRLVLATRPPSPQA